MNVEARLSEPIGEPSGVCTRAQPQRSGGDGFSACGCATPATAPGSRLKDLQGALLTGRNSTRATLMPGFTHLQTAQPVTFGHHLMAYVEMFGRDAGRFLPTPAPA